MKVIIAGSRGIADYGVVRQAVIDSGLWHRHRNSLEIVCGMAPGVDLLGLEFAKRNGLVWHEFPAKWDDINAIGAVIRYRKGKPYNAKAGHDRNWEMAHFAQALIAVWDGQSKGTKQMIEAAYKSDLFVYVHKV